jgi:hypothetical protein
MASVAFLVKTISSGPAPMKAAIRRARRLVGVGALLGELVSTPVDRGVERS